MSKEMIIYAGSINRDHVHILIGIPPQLSVSRAVQYLKVKSSHRLLTEYKALRKRYWGQHLWARGYWLASSGNVTTDYRWYERLDDRGIPFVIRQDRKGRYQNEEHLICDQTIELSILTEGICPMRLRCMDTIILKRTLNTSVSAITTNYIPQILWPHIIHAFRLSCYSTVPSKNLKIMVFIGTSSNAVMKHIWIAICFYLLLLYLKFLRHCERDLQQILRLLQLNLLADRSLLELSAVNPQVTKSPRSQQVLVIV